MQSNQVGNTCIELKEASTMKNNIIKTELNVINNIVSVIRINNIDYISLTDLAKTQNDESPADVVKNWMRNKETLSFLGVW